MKRRPSKRWRQRPKIRYFTCTVCGAAATAPKRKGRTHPGHIKTMYCYCCKAVTDHVQVE